VAGYVWRRQTFASTNTLQGQWWIDAIPAGTKYVRCHFRWGFYGDSPFNVDLQTYAESMMVLGLCTTYGNGTETPPLAITQSNDQAPPTQRWIYWEGRSAYPTAMSEAGGVVTWRDTGGTEPTDTKAMVLAAAPPAGQTLNLWASWENTFNWAADAGNSVIYISISDLSYHP
jgi:hypothetical protein